MSFFIGIFSIQLHIVHVYTTNQVIGLTFRAKTFKGPSLGMLIPQAKSTCVIFRKHTGHTIHSVGDIIALRIPPTECIGIFNDVQEGVQHVFFTLKQQGI